ncbi:P2R1A-PPP2R2A-interacting phosphatase regulator 1-like [Saccoglossus kowalevskii]
MELNAMEVDSYEPPCFKTGGPLRRSSSLPSVYTDSSRSSSSTSSSNKSISEWLCSDQFNFPVLTLLFPSITCLIQHLFLFSQSSVPIKIPSRVTQIKQEEKADINRRESLHEKEVTASFQLSHSWEEFNISESSNNRCDKSLGKFAEPLTIFPSTLPLSASPSPSPTRITGKVFEEAAKVVVQPNYKRNHKKKKCILL